MKKLNMKNLLIVGLVAFIAFGFIQNTPAAYLKSQAEINAKGEIIVVVTEARFRSSASLKSKVIGSVKIGTILSVLRQSRDWYQVSLANGRTAWISGTIVEDFTEARRGLIYQQIADKYLQRKELDFKTASEVFDFLTTARYAVKGRNVQAVLELKRLRILHSTLESIPFDKLGQAPYKTFTDANQFEIAYSEPAGQWFVDAQNLWDLREKYNDLPIADDIAWEAANTSLPGECEGFITCHLPKLTMTYGEYLKFYPAGKYSGQVLKSIVSDLNSMAGNDGSSYEPPFDAADRAEFAKSIAELRAIVAKVSLPERRQALNLLDQLAKKHK